MVCIPKTYKRPKTVLLPLDVVTFDLGVVSSGERLRIRGDSSHLDGRAKAETEAEYYCCQAAHTGWAGTGEILGLHYMCYRAGLHYTESFAV